MTWTEAQVTGHGSNFNWETHASRRDGFWGDYIYVSAAGGRVVTTWTDSRDLVPGADPRETGADAPRATWRLNGTLRITTTENASQG